MTSAFSIFSIVQILDEIPLGINLFTYVVCLPKQGKN